MTPETFDAIIKDIASGEPTRRAVAAHGVNPNTFYTVLGTDEDAAKRYAHARMSSMDSLADEAMAIADDPDVPSDHKRVMVDTRKWFLSKLAPKRYGDKLELAGDGANPLQIVITPTDAKL